MSSENLCKINQTFRKIIKSKWLWGIILLGLLILIYTRWVPKTGKIDDWQYHPPSFDLSMGLGVLGWIILGFFGLLLIVWLGGSIFLIIKGKPLEEGGVKKRNPKRIMGLVILFGPVGILLVSILTTLVLRGVGVLTLLFLIIPILLIGFLVGSIIYAKKNKIKFATRLLVVLSFLVLGGGAFWFLLVFMTATSGSTMMGPATGFLGPVPAFQRMSVAESEIGFAVGGAKDISNFRKNIEYNYLPLPTDITYEGLFYEYFFDTGEQEKCEKLFCPSYSYAISQDPFSEEEEYYLAVGLNSGIKAADFHRKKLNLVIVLDISGSMSSPFSKYYYDQFGERVLIPGIEEEDEESDRSKMGIAAESVVALLDHLGPEDRFGMVLFNDNAYVAKSLSLVEKTDMQAIKNHILLIEATGGTQMSAGMKKGTALMEEVLDADPNEYENRIIFLTDAMPNIGETSETGLLGMTKLNADTNVYSTFIGIGVDFNTELVDYITKIRGANYYSVHSAKQFKERMDDEFEYMVTPLVFNLLLKLEAEGYEIKKVYGSPEANEATGEIMKVNTLFPSKKEEEETKGGLVLLQLKKTSSDANLKLKLTYEDRTGVSGGDEKNIVLERKESDFYDNTGIQKGILLSRYACLMKNWINDESESYLQKKPLQPSVDYEKGIVVPPKVEPQLGKWERQSIPLQVSDHYRDLFRKFAAYFEKEMDSIGDETLNQELVILNNLISL